MSVPFRVPKSQGFQGIFPAGTQKLHDAGAWALYYSPTLLGSFLVTDVGDAWRIHHYVGRLTVNYAGGMMKGRRLQMQNTGCCGDDR